MKKNLLRFQVLATLLLLIAACSTPKQTTVKNEQVKSETKTDNRKSADLETLYWQRRQEAKMNFVQADVDFMTGMIGHHAQALIMSALALKNNASPDIVILSKRIINAQKDEINLMQRWLADRGQKVPQVYIEGLLLSLKMGDEPILHFYEDGQEHDMQNMEHNARHMAEDSNEEMNNSGHDKSKKAGDMEGMMHNHTNMPGMLNQSQLEELASTKGEDFDQLFLSYMIQHHTGAITMVKNLVAVDGAAQELEIGKVAGDINVDQITEIERMRLMLRQRMNGTSE
jgi:uncharacterized protein (DUF305 family)